jgi:hypothetical protein
VTVTASKRTDRCRRERSFLSVEVDGAPLRTFTDLSTPQRTTTGTTSGTTLARLTAIYSGNDCKVTIAPEAAATDPSLRLGASWRATEPTSPCERVAALLVRC